MAQLMCHRRRDRQLGNERQITEVTELLHVHIKDVSSLASSGTSAHTTTRSSDSLTVLSSLKVAYKHMQRDRSVHSTVTSTRVKMEAERWCCVATELGTEKFNH